MRAACHFSLAALDCGYSMTRGLWPELLLLNKTFCACVHEPLPRKTERPWEEWLQEGAPLLLAAAETKETTIALKNDYRFNLREPLDSHTEWATTVSWSSDRPKHFNVSVLFAYWSCASRTKSPAAATAFARLALSAYKTTKRVVLLATKQTSPSFLINASSARSTSTACTATSERRVVIGWEN